MPSTPLSEDDFRAAQSLLARAPRGDVQLASRIVAEVLMRAAGHDDRKAALEERCAALGASDATAEVDGVRPIEIVRQGPRDARERAVVSVLIAQHLGSLLDGERGAGEFRERLSMLDALELHGPYAPYAAARVVFDAAHTLRFDAVLSEVPEDTASSSALDAVRALRGGAPRSGTGPSGSRAVPVANEGPVPSVAGEVEGLHRGAIARTVGIVTGWSFVRGVVLGALRVVFSFRRPVTVSLDGELFRVVGHTELMGRTLRTFDVRYPVSELVELRRETRYPALPAAISAVAVGLGALLGARAVVEGAGVAYFPLIAIGIGLVLGGLMFDLLLRALFPGLRGAVRLIVRARDVRAVVITNLDASETDRLLDSIDRRFGASGRPAASGDSGARNGPVRTRRDSGAISSGSPTRTTPQG